MSYRPSCMVPIADDMLVTAMYVLILASVADLECNSHRLMDTLMAINNLRAYITLIKVKFMDNVCVVTCPLTLKIQMYDS